MATSLLSLKFFYLDTYIPAHSLALWVKLPGRGRGIVHLCQGQNTPSHKPTPHHVRSYSSGPEKDSHLRNSTKSLGGSKTQHKTSMFWLYTLHNSKAINMAGRRKERKKEISEASWERSGQQKPYVLEMLPFCTEEEACPEVRLTST